MLQRVQVANDQELTPDDLNRLGSFPEDTIDALTSDAITAGLGYTGLTVSQTNVTTVQMAAGRFYSGGKMYGVTGPTSYALNTYLPPSGQRYVILTAGGVTADGPSEQRGFLLSSDGDQDEPRSTVTTKVRSIGITVKQGAANSSPVVPTVDAGTVLIATILLSTSGIVSITMNTDGVLANVQDHEDRVTGLEAWRAVVDPTVGNLQTDLAGLAVLTNSKADRTVVAQANMMISRLLAAIHFPGSISASDTDIFADATKTDKTQAGYDAIVDHCLRFPPAAESKANLALFNPTDPTVTQSPASLVLPKYVQEALLGTSGSIGALAFGDYQPQTYTLKSYRPAVTEVHYGPNYNDVQRWYQVAPYVTVQGPSDNTTPLVFNANPQASMPAPNLTVVQEAESGYILQASTSSIPGYFLGQTLLLANTRWITAIGLKFTSVGPSGTVTVLLTETAGGKPDLTKVVAQATVAQSALKVAPTETLVPFEPTLLAGGKRYAICLITQGAHAVSVTSSASFTEGTLFTSHDGDFFQGDLTKDLEFTLYGAKFSTARTEINLGTVALTGGMTDINIQTPQIVPPGCEMHYEVQIGSRWYSLLDSANPLITTVPNLVPLRAVLLGTSTLAPAFQLATNALVASRCKTQFTHWSTLRTVPSTTQVQLQIVVRDYYNPTTSLLATLVSGGNTYTAGGFSYTVEPDQQSYRFVYSFTGLPNLTSYRVKLVGQTTGLPYQILERTDASV